MKPQYNNNWQNSDAKRQSPQSMSSGTPDPSVPPYNANYHLHNGNSQVSINFICDCVEFAIDICCSKLVNFVGTARSRNANKLHVRWLPSSSKPNSTSESSSRLSSETGSAF